MCTYTKSPVLYRIRVTRRFDLHDLCNLGCMTKARSIHNLVPMVIIVDGVTLALHVLVRQCYARQGKVMERDVLCHRSASVSFDPRARSARFRKDDAHSRHVQKALGLPGTLITSRTYVNRSLCSTDTCAVGIRAFILYTWKKGIQKTQRVYRYKSY